jgi:hypothetical protein
MVLSLSLNGEQGVQENNESYRKVTEGWEKSNNGEHNN